MQTRACLKAFFCHGKRGHIHNAFVLILWFNCVIFCDQLRVQDNGRSRKFLEIYDERLDEFSGRTLFTIPGNYKIKSSGENTVQFMTHIMTTSSDSLKTLDVSASGKLGAMYKLISLTLIFSPSATLKVKDHAQSAHLIVRLDARTVTEGVNPCSVDFDNEKTASLIDDAKNYGSHVLTQKTYGYSIDVVISVSSLVKEFDLKVKVELNRILDFILGWIGIRTSYERHNKTSFMDKSISIKVSTKHLSYPYPLPTAWQEVGTFVKNVTEYANRNNVKGGVLDYHVEELRLIDNCHKGTTNQPSVQQTSYEIVLAATETVLKEIEIQERENYYLKTGFTAVRNCMSEKQETDFLLAQDTVKTELDNIKYHIQQALDRFRNKVIEYKEYVKELRLHLELLFTRIYSVKNRIGPELSQNIEFLAKATSYGYSCISRDDFTKMWVPQDELRYFYLFSSSEIRYYLDNDASAGNFSEFGTNYQTFGRNRHWVPSYYEHVNTTVILDRGTFGLNHRETGNMGNMFYIPTIYSLLFYIRYCNDLRKKDNPKYTVKCYFLDCELNVKLCEKMKLPTDLVGLYPDSRGLYREYGRDR